MRKILASIAIVGALALSGCSGGFLDLNTQQAADSCDVPSEDGTISFTGAKADNAKAMADISCVLYALDVSEATVTRIETTRMIDGVQTATWNGVAATWSYDDFNGLTLVLEPK